MPAYDARRGADGRPDAANGRSRGDAADHGRPGVRVDQGADPHHLRRGRARARGTACRGQRFSAQGHPANPAARSDRGGGRGRRTAGAVGDEAADRAVHRSAQPAGFPARGRPDRPRARGPRCGVPRAVQPGDRRHPAHGLRDGEDPRQPPAHQARVPRPGAAGDACLRVGADRPGEQPDLYLESRSGRDLGQMCAPHSITEIGGAASQAGTANRRFSHDPTTARSHDLPRARLLHRNRHRSRDAARRHQRSAQCLRTRRSAGRDHVHDDPPRQAQGAVGQLRAEPLGKAALAVRPRRPDAPGHQCLRHCGPPGRRQPA